MKQAELEWAAEQEIMRSSETSLNFYETSRRHTPEDINYPS
jgi:hypothetical protein